jgi:GcrA cell cycle regulator
MSQAGWSDDRVTTLTLLWRDGQSASQIAKALGGVTRNAVIGKIHRLGLSGRPAPSRPARVRAVRPARLPAAAKPHRPKIAPVFLATPATLEGPGVIASLTALGAHTCRWPIGDPTAEDFSFCGRLAKGPYCPAHKTQAVRPGTAWRADRDPVVRRALAGLV